MPQDATAAKSEVLSGWKEIARYMGLGVRTVQRYELQLRLPILRPAGKFRAGVIALKTQLDDWISSAPPRPAIVLMKDSQAAFKRYNSVGADFLRIDSEIALTFSHLALESSSLDKKRRTCDVARKAYDSIVRLREGISLDEVQSTKLNANLARLKSELQSLGQTF